MKNIIDPDVINSYKYSTHCPDIHYVNNYNATHHALNGMRYSNKI